MTIRGDSRRLVMIVESLWPWWQKQPQSSSSSRRNLSCLVCSKFRNEDSENESWSVGCRCLCAWVWRGRSNNFWLKWTAKPELKKHERNEQQKHERTTNSTTTTTPPASSLTAHPSYPSTLKYSPFTYRAYFSTTPPP